MAKRIPTFIAHRADDLKMLDEARALLDGLVDPQAKEGILPDEAWLYDYIYNTDGLDGSPLERDDIDLIFKGLGCDKPLEYIDDARGDLGGWKLAGERLEEGRTLDEELIKEMHAVMALREDDRLKAGTYRSVDVEIVGSPYEVEYPEFIAEDMADMLKRILGSEAHPVVRAALLHAEFESIHPFLGANGRVGRMCMNYLLMSTGFLPIDIPAKERRLYLDALRSYQIEDDPVQITEMLIDNEVIEMREKLALYDRDAH